MICPHCGNQFWYATEREYHTIIVNENGDFCEDVSCDDVEIPYGPFSCTKCGYQREEIREERIER